MSTQLDKIAAEMLRRKRARESLVGFSKSIIVPGSPAAGYVEEDPETWVFKPVETDVALHHVVTMTALEECIRTPYGRLMIFEPPGSAKSTYASAVAPAWAMGMFPELQVLATSYADVPIERHSKRCRQICRSGEYVNIWEDPTTIVRGSNAVKDWELTNGSRFYCGGLEGAITSTRCDFGLIDDPVKNREAADSETIRRKTLAEYRDTFLTRLKPKASIALIQTRWHLDDLAGAILPEGYDGRSGWIDCRDGQRWYVLNIPAKAVRADDPLGRKPGEYLWPEWFTPRHWAIYEPDPAKEMGPDARTWSALFQQDPQPGDGGLFGDNIHRFNLADMPTGKVDEKARARGEEEFELVYFGTGDWAVTDEMMAEDPDYTVQGLWMLDTVGDLWLYGGWYGRKDLTKSLTEWHRMTTTAIAPGTDDGVRDWIAEAGIIRRAMEPILRKMQQETDEYAAFTWLPSVRDKIANSTSFRARVQAGKVHVINGPFGDFVIQQLKQFPLGRHDDAVDMCGLAGRIVDKRYNPEKPPPPKKKRPVEFGSVSHLEFEDDADVAEEQRRYMR